MLVVVRFEDEFNESPSLTPAPEQEWGRRIRPVAAPCWGVVVPVRDPHEKPVQVRAEEIVDDDGSPSDLRGGCEESVAEVLLHPLGH